MTMCIEARCKNCPTGKSLPGTVKLSIPLAKNIPLAPSGKSVINSARLTRYEGRLAIVTNVRWDAVDADCAIGECA